MTITDFMRALAQICWEGGSLDGGELQGLLVDVGVLVPIQVDEPCGEGCNCAEFGDFPMTCYRLADQWREEV
jgi:hypothetical protein